MTATEQGWTTRLSSIADDRPTLLGYDLLELACRYDFVELAYLSWTSRFPTPQQKRMLNVLLGATIIHGIAPTGALARGLYRTGVPVQVAISGALLSVGDVHAGVGEQLGEAIERAALVAGYTGDSSWNASVVEECARLVIDDFAHRNTRIPGFGHPAHPEGDPRAPVLFAQAHELGIAGYFCAVVPEIDRQLELKAGRPIACNADGAMTAILEDLGIGWRYSRVLIMVARTAGLGAQVIEEALTPTPRWRDAMLPNEVYIGPPDRPLPALED